LKQHKLEDMTFQVSEAGFLYTVRFTFLST
jgi:hypothetical protein